MLEELMACEHCEDSFSLNYLMIPVTIFNIDKEGAEGFNKIYFYLKSLNLNKLEVSPSGAVKAGYRVKRPGWYIKKNRYCVELTVLLLGFAWRIQFRSAIESKMSGRAAFSRFKRILAKDGIDLESYAVENGIEVKSSIEKPPIGAARPIFYHKIFNNCHHIDFHSSFAGGLANSHPEFRPTLEKLFKNRENNEIYKNILNFSIGFMQSIQGCGAKYAQLSKDAIHDNNSRIKKLAEKLTQANRTVLCYNVDGIWYCGAIYHGEGEGEGLGEWHNDVTNCSRFRMKSPGAYEYEEDGVYYPVIRGISNDLKEDWSWGDIYSQEKTKASLFEFTEEEGITNYETSL